MHHAWSVYSELNQLRIILGRIHSKYWYTSNACIVQHKCYYKYHTGACGERNDIWERNRASSSPKILFTTSFLVPAFTCTNLYTINNHPSSIRHSFRPSFSALSANRRYFMNDLQTTYHSIATSLTGRSMPPLPEFVQEACILRAVHRNC